MPLFHGSCETSFVVHWTDLGRGPSVSGRMNPRKLVPQLSKAFQFAVSGFQGRSFPRPRRFIGCQKSVHPLFVGLEVDLALLEVGFFACEPIFPLHLSAHCYIDFRFESASLHIPLLPLLPRTEIVLA